METSVTVERINDDEAEEFLPSHEILRENLKAVRKRKTKKPLKKYKCKVCKKAFKDKRGLQLHETQHDPEHPYQCEQCSYKTKNRQYLNRHTLKVHKKEQKNQECDVCGKRFFFKSLLDKHFRIHSGEKPNKCDICGKAFNSRYSLNTHKYIHTNEKPYKCSFCDYACRDSSSLRKHHSSHLGLTKSHPCQQCSNQYTTEARLIAHVNEKHTKVEVATHACDMCGSMFKKKWILASHIRAVHEKSKTCKCGICGKVISNHANLKAHLRVHIDARPYKCTHPGCTKKFKDNSTLRKHTVIHYPVQHVACTECGRRFARQSRLAMHLKRRAASKNGVCPTNHHKRYKRHFGAVKERDPNKPKLICDSCGYRTTSKTKLAKHIKYGHGNLEDRECKICQKTFRKNDYLKLHYWNSHSVKYKLKTKLKPMVVIKQEPEDIIPDMEIDLLDIDKDEPFSDFEYIHDQNSTDMLEPKYNVNEELDINMENLQESVCNRNERLNDIDVSEPTYESINQPEVRTNLEPRSELVNDIDVSEPTCESINEPEIRTNLEPRNEQVNDVDVSEPTCESINQPEAGINLDPTNELVNGNVVSEPKSNENEQLNDRNVSEPTCDQNELVNDKDISEPECSEKEPENEIDISEPPCDVNYPVNDTDISERKYSEELAIDSASQTLKENENEINEQNTSSTEKVNESEVDEKPERLSMQMSDFIQHIILAEQSDEDIEEDTEKYVQKRIEELLRQSNEKNGIRIKKTSFGRKLKKIDSNEGNDILLKLSQTRKLAEDSEGITGESQKRRRDKKRQIRKTKKGSKRVQYLKSSKSTSDRDGSEAGVAEKRQNNGNIKFKFDLHQCYVCLKVFKTKPDLINHCKEHFDVCNEVTLKKCPLCPFVTHSDIKRHVRLIHKIDINFSFMRINDKKNNDSGSRYYFDIHNDNIKQLEIIPSIKILNKKACMDMDRRNRELKDKSVLKRKLIKKGKEWIVEHEKLDVSDRVVPDLKDKSNYLESLKQLNLESKKKGVQILFPCNVCDKVCQNLSALTLHLRRHNPNAKPFKPRNWRQKTKGQPALGAVETAVNTDNRNAKPKPIVNKHKCDPKLKDFYEKNIKGGDIEFWHFLKIYNKMSRENVNDFRDLETRTEFGIHFSEENENKTNDETPVDSKHDNLEVTPVSSNSKEAENSNVNTESQTCNKKKKIAKLVKNMKMRREEHKKRCEAKAKLREKIANNIS